ncbi:hypothetical protein PV08_06984 [Exophiala spinifera]|uniref:FAD-binding domain-containing protein n=1 Tax=Exophiala spinifera TaxID=91928 RepID=A0A0D2B5J8_9EURO|nr:uncharacterized protein PV08_06984 [Exophiala spinifera]KIW14203.1 hypothetical protein PV08_06984 [Exophiala spinifera]
MNGPSACRMSGLKILVAGGSIGGLATAVALKAQGHYVTVYEQALTPDTLGAGITIFPNSLRALDALGIDTNQIKSVRIKRLIRTSIEVDGSANTVGDEIEEKDWPWYQTTYRDLFVSLWEAAHDSSRPGPRIDVVSSKSVISIDPVKAMVYFSDGTQAVGDAIIGADGVHSVCRSFVPGGSFPRFRIKRHVFRALIPRERLAKDPRTIKFIEKEGDAYCYIYQERSLLITPASNGENCCIKFLYEDRMAFKNLSKDWRDPSSKLKLLRLADGLPEECMALFEKISDRDLQDQPIWDMDPLTTFRSNRMVLMGDAAHPMPPYCGQRIAMALEDALALGVLLETATPASEVDERLMLYSATRKTRAVAVQKTMRGLSESDMRNFATEFEAYSFHNYILGHDELEHMAQALRVWKKQRCLTQGSSESLEPRQQRPAQVWKECDEDKKKKAPQPMSPSPKKWWSIGRQGSKTWSRVFSSAETPRSVATTS